MERQRQECLLFLAVVQQEPLYHIGMPLLAFCFDRNDRQWIRLFQIIGVGIMCMNALFLSRSLGGI